jgi:hypothetical protein
MSSVARLLAAVSFLAVVACSASRGNPFEPAPAVTVVRVSNRSYCDVVVYVADGNTPFRLGVVPGLGGAVLRIPNQLASGGVRLLIRARDTDRLYATDLALPGAGGALALTVQPMLVASEIYVLSHGALEP